MIGLGNEEGAIALGLGDGLPERFGLRRAQSREDLVLVAFDTLRSRNHRNELWKTLQLGQSEPVEALVKARISATLRRHPAADDAGSIDFCL